jgi:hypothetical protein
MGQATYVNQYEITSERERERMDLSLYVSAGRAEPRITFQKPEQYFSRPKNNFPDRKAASEVILPD